ncbi:MAG: peptide chain release factor 2 [Acidobacteriota bacterium]
MILEEHKQEFRSLREKAIDLRGVFDEASVRNRLEEVHRITAAPGFWDDPARAAAILKDQRTLEARVKDIERLDRLVGDLDTLLEFEAAGEEAGEEFAATLGELRGFLGELEVRALLSGPLDPNNAIVTIHPGAGGTESQDWALMLHRMYVRWAERHGYEVELWDWQDGDTAGIKASTFLVKGDYAYGYLKTESGVHRLVRISPFDAAARRHTSFTSVFVSPEVNEEIEIEIADKDVRVDIFRAGGHGGQNVNKVSTAVRITHFPTGIVVTCQNERSQLQNRETAWKILRSRLYQLELEKRNKERQAVEDAKKEIAWGSQIRSYVLQPYRLVKDHRTGTEVGNADAVLDGDLDPFIQAALKARIL